MSKSFCGRVRCEAAAEVERLTAYQNETAKAWTKLTESQEVEIERLQEIRRLAQDYCDHFMQDEADEPEVCITDEQHRMARALRDALNDMRALEQLGEKTNG